jgi:hypothetical protein
MRNEAIWTWPSAACLALEWYAQLDAPIKRVFRFENAARSACLEQFEAFHRILLDTILPETCPSVMRRSIPPCWHAFK